LLFCAKLNSYMREITLTKGKFAIVDDIDYEWAMQWKWQSHSAGYAVRFESQPRNHRPAFLMHREIAKRMGLDVSRDVDHKNRLRYDNQRANLRAATRALNVANTERKRNSATGFIGVSFDGRYRQPYITAIQMDGKRKYLGRYASVEDAAKAYDNAARRLQGEFYVDPQLPHGKNLAIILPVVP
jgi:hypothetical protein